ncbi:unnamed protein product [Leuciscus chuanchicus]
MGACPLPSHTHYENHSLDRTQPGLSEADDFSGLSRWQLVSYLIFITVAKPGLCCVRGNIDSTAERAGIERHEVIAVTLPKPCEKARTGQELKESCLHKEYSPWTVSNGSLMQEHKQRERLQWCSGPPPAWANPKKPLKDHYLFIFIAQAVSSPVDEMQVYQHAGHKGNYTTQMMLKDKDLKIVFVCVCVERGSSCKHDQRLIFYPKDL